MVFAAKACGKGGMAARPLEDRSRMLKVVGLTVLALAAIGMGVAMASSADFASHFSLGGSLGVVVGAVGASASSIGLIPLVTLIHDARAGSEKLNAGASEGVHQSELGLEPSAEQEKQYLEALIARYKTSGGAPLGLLAFEQELSSGRLYPCLRAFALRDYGYKDLETHKKLIIDSIDAHYKVSSILARQQALDQIPFCPATASREGACGNRLSQERPVALSPDGAAAAAGRGGVTDAQLEQAILIALEVRKAGL